MAHSNELSVFNVTELTRLADGFSTDDMVVATWPFTTKELSRPIVYKTAIAATAYADHPSRR